MKTLSVLYREFARDGEDVLELRLSCKDEVAAKLQKCEREGVFDSDVHNWCGTIVAAMGLLEGKNYRMIDVGVVTVS